MNADIKIFINIISMTCFIGSLSFTSHQLCNWYGCYNWNYFLRTDMICNACTDVSYHLKNYHVSLYASAITIATFKMTTLVNSATTKSDKLLFEK